ncbi:Origin recognition complex, subunit 1 [Perkinsus olseni]|nr:Origin recognition complex, subunit 1 [Perkinsus olseni]
MGFFTWEVFKVSEDKPHRKGNDCKRIKADLVQCMQQTQCWKSGALFEECMQSKDPAWVTKECMHLRDAYMQCRKCLIVPNLRLYGNPYS